MNIKNDLNGYLESIHLSHFFEPEKWILDSTETLLKSNLKNNKESKSLKKLLTKERMFDNI